VTEAANAGWHGVSLDRSSRGGGRRKTPQLQEPLRLPPRPEKNDKKMPVRGLTDGPFNRILAAILGPASTTSKIVFHDHSMFLNTHPASF
jgi:hypothetical protein